MAAKKLSDQEVEELQAYRVAKEKEEREKIGLSDKYLNYTPKEGEENHVHLLVGFIARANPTDRSKDELGTTFNHILNEPMYRNFLDNLANSGYKIVKVLHLPKGVSGPKEYFEAKAKAAEAKQAKAKAGPKNPTAAIILE